MEYKLKKELFSIESLYEVNSEDNTKYTVKAINDENIKEIRISSVESGEVARINELDGLFKIYLYGRMVLKINVEISEEKRINLRSIYGEEYEVVAHKGTIENSSFIIRKNGLRIAKAFRNSLEPMKDYHIDIIDAENQVFVLAIAMVVSECYK
ncbi:hypothetical protein [Clostridium grantii]|uniref:Uncharacterized protein n=1 Tax=Clostridium grantii DSM 8605 TaxID=1121316 RepID=A0A1M5RTL4_9CLOT|nr:hypothetical protein [Clostridium grantii]SHH29645.1 hypothetical protein SAMN02745207_00717 [Clostridium grantii DSM 8605]